MVSKRRRYDTVELVSELKRERRNAILLSLAGIGILVILLLLYITAIGDDEVPNLPGADVVTTEVPTADKDPLLSAGSAPPGVNPDPPAEAESEPEPEPEPEAVEPSPVRIVLTKKGVLWVDGKKLGKVKKKRLTLAPGSHEIKAKFGKKVITEEIEMEAGRSYELRIDAKRKKVKLRAVD